MSGLDWTREKCRTGDECSEYISLAKHTPKWYKMEQGKVTRTRHGRGTQIFSLCVPIIITFIAQCVATEVNPPSIDTITGSNIILGSGQTLRLTCRGDKPLVWKPNRQELLKDERLKITTSAGNPRKYTSTLTLSNVQGTDAGEFFCSYGEMSHDNSDDEPTWDFVSVFVTVVDEDKLLFPAADVVIHVSVGAKVVLACRPSSSKVTIQILNDTNNDEPIPLTDSNYDVMEGFIIGSAKISDGGHYTCKATLGKKEENIHFHVNVLAPVNAVNNIQMKVTHGGFITVGEEFQVECSTEQAHGVHYTLHLELPDKVVNKNESRVQFEGFHGKPNNPNNNLWINRTIIKNARKEDSGNYTCAIVGHFLNKRPLTRTRIVKVFDKGESFVDVSTGVENITVRRNTSAKWVINITSFPLDFNYSWQNPKGEEIDTAKISRFSVNNSSKEGEFTLEIRQVTLEDMGPYKFEVYIPNVHPERKTLNLRLTVKSPPIVTIGSEKSRESPINCMVGQICKVSCKVEAYPPAKNYWTWQKCNSTESCEPPMNVTENGKQKINHGAISFIEFNATHHGKYTCYAENVISTTHHEKLIRIVDYPGQNPITIIKPEEVVEGDNLKLTCVASKLGNNRNLAWRQVDGEKETYIDSTSSEESQWSTRNTLEIRDVQKSSIGTYKCTTGGSNPLESSEHLDVLSIAAPQILDSNLNNSKVSMKLGESKELVCNATGRPKPDVTWAWDDHPIQEWSSVRVLTDLRYVLSHDNRVLELKYVPAEAQGRFKCQAQNRNGSTSAFLDIVVTGTRTFSNTALVIILSLFLAVIIFGAILARYKYKQGEMNRFLKEIKQQDFYNGAIENINPELSVTDQAYLLPFDSRWEFPKDRLKLGIQLGAGAFGRVVKADAFGILDFEPKTTVAVKMVKQNADESHFKALMSELKIMVHLGKHINVVNLLGACTKNLAKKKELFVIVEYCKYGSLLSYMHRNKRTFINQLDPARGIIDPNIDRPLDRNSAQSQAQRTLHYAQLTFMDAGNSRKPASNGYRTLEEFNGTNPDYPEQGNSLRLHEISSGLLTPNRSSTEHYVPESQVESVCTGISYLSNGPMTTDGTTKGRSSCGSQWQDHYRGDYQARDVQPIRTTDLLCWAFQIARGMDYLATRKVLHGDLAARNVLLAENNVVKICDFGLAKEMYKDYKYKKKSEGVLLPVKWMAIESIYYGLFSTQSDCWSFGVVLWELFTLGKTPYPGMEADERFYKRISEGYRMEKPPLAPSCVYDIMLECWAQEPTERPTFSALVDRIGDMMEEGLRNHYVELNAPYMIINREYIMSGQTDYLLTMGKTEYSSNSQRPSPERKYQNVPEELDSAGYLIPSINPRPPSPTSPLQIPSSPQYQNIDTTALIHQPRLEAHNDGYRFLNVRESSEKIGDQTELDEDNKGLTLQIEFNPTDVKEFYGLRDDSTSPNRNSLEEDDHHVNIKVGDNGIKGVDNMNYVPNNMMLSNKLHLMKNGLQGEPHSHLTSGGDVSNESRRQKRQKNDSGLGSIDSTHFDNHHNSKYGNHHDDLQQCTDFNSPVQSSNGYVSHQNITTLS